MILGGELFDEGRVELATNGGRELFFYPGCNKNTKARRRPPQGIVIHWTGAENSPDRVRRTLESRDLSIDFVVDSALEPSRRRIVQMADPLVTQTAHAGIANPRFLGIEVVSRGFAKREDVVGSDLRDRTDLDWTVPRDLFTDRIHHRPINFASYHPDSLHDVVWLVECICGRLGIPRAIPWMSIGLADDPATARVLRRMADDRWCRMLEEITPVVHAGQTWIPTFDRDVRLAGRAGRFRGVMGHFHVHREKCDPGTQLFYALWREGFNPAGLRAPATLPK